MLGRSRTQLRSRAALLVPLALGALPFRAKSADPPSPAVKLSVAAAADLKFAFEELASAFRTLRPDVVLEPTFGSSGSFFAQVQNGAPFDVFLSADTDYPRRLHQAGLTLDAVFGYATGRLVLWVPAGSALDVEKAGWRALLAPSVRRIAIANPKHAPYGRAAEAALRSLGLLEGVKDRLVLGENVSQAAQFVQSGSADAGFIALSLALSPTMARDGRSWRVPADAYPRLEQGGVILRSSKVPAAARSFRDFLMGPEGRQVLSRHGFEVGGN